MKKYLIPYLILLGAGFLNAQDTQVYTDANFVIANGGLNLRSAPSINSRKLTNIPFGSTVKYLSDKSFKIDSIIIREGYYGGLIKGNWVKVEYNKMKGYVLDIYLHGRPNNENRFGEKYSGDYVLLYPGCNCNLENLHNPAGWEWFGYFKDGDGKFKIEKINISYYRIDDHFCSLLIYASKRDSLYFIIGSKNGRLSKAHAVQGKSLYLEGYSLYKTVKKTDLDNASVELISKGFYQLYLKRGKKRQLLNKPEYDFPVEIEFMGDLDGDSKDDYIISYGDKGGIVILYLTSKAKPGKLIEPVAMFFISYCC